MFRTNVDVIRLDVSVLDKERRPVRGLSSTDFTVLENGQERPIVAFAPVELPPAPPVETSTAPWVRDAPRDVVSNEGADEGRLVVIAFDWSIRSYDQQLARRIASTAIDGLGPTDQAALVFTKPNAAAGMPQGFTADRARLRAAVNRPFAPVDTCKPPACDSKQIVNPERYQDGECLCGLCTLEALTRLAGTLRPVSSRPKVLLFIGTYVRTYEAMKPTRIPPVIQGPDPHITPTFSELPGATDCPGRLLDARRAFERAAHAANLTVHVLDPVGLGLEGSDPLGPGRMRERLDSLPVMADITGGRTVSNTNAPENQVASILEESSAYYVLGFEPGSGRANGDRHIEVRMKPRGLTARARDSYDLAMEPTSAAARAIPPLTRSVSDVLPSAEVALEATAVPLVAGGRSAALIVGRLGARVSGPILLLDAAFTPRSVPVVSRRLTVQPANPGSTQGLGLVSALALAPGSYEIRVGTQLSDGTAGSVHTFLDVPDFARESLSMSGVLLHVSPEEPSAPRNEIEGVLPFAPTARRTFTQADAVSAFVQVSQGTSRTSALTRVTLTMRIVDVQDQVVRQQSNTLELKAFASHRTANSKLAIPISGLTAGRYLLRLEAKAETKSVERLVRFSIE